MPKQPVIAIFVAVAGCASGPPPDCTTLVERGVECTSDCITVMCTSQAGTGCDNLALAPSTYDYGGIVVTTQEELRRYERLCRQADGGAILDDNDTCPDTDLAGIDIFVYCRGAGPEPRL